MSGREPFTISAMRPLSTTTVVFAAGFGSTQSISVAFVRIVLMSLRLDSRVLCHFQPASAFGFNERTKIARCSACGFEAAIVESLRHIRCMKYRADFLGHSRDD